MAWQNPRTWETGELVTAAMLNQDIRDNENALMSKFDDVTHSEPTRALDTVYTNSSKIRVVTVSLRLYSNVTSETRPRAGAMTDAQATPTTNVAEVGVTLSGVEDFTMSMTFVVKPNEKYKVWSNTSIGGNVSIKEWHEWDLF